MLYVYILYTYYICILLYYILYIIYIHTFYILYIITHVLYIYIYIYIYIYDKAVESYFRRFGHCLCYDIDSIDIFLEVITDS